MTRHLKAMGLWLGGVGLGIGMMFCPLWVLRDVVLLVLGSLFYLATYVVAGDL